MAFRLQINEPVQSEIQRIANEQIDKAIGEFRESALDVHAKVHQIRKRCKKLRGLIRLVRPCFEETYQQENQCIRDAARQLSDFRDAKVMIETYDLVMQRFDNQINRSAFSPIRSQLTRQLHAINEKKMDVALSRVVEELQSVQSRVSKWQLDRQGFDAVGKGSTKTRDRATKQFKRVRDNPDAELFHQWRKRAKYHYYPLRLLRRVWPPMMKVMIKSADQLGDLLGDDHDLVIFAGILHRELKDTASDADPSVMMGLIDQRRRELQADALLLGRRLLAESSACFSERLEVYWQSQ